MTDKITRVFDCIQYQNNNFPQKKSLVYKENDNGKVTQVKILLIFLIK